MAEQSSAFPAYIEFAKDSFAASFLASSDVIEWATAEYKYWHDFAANTAKPARSLMLTNAAHMQELQKLSANEKELSEKLQTIRQEYIPSKGPAGEMLSDLQANGKKDVAGLVYVLLFSPTPASLDQGNPNTVEAMTISSAYRAVGRLIGARHRIESGLTEVRRIQHTFEAEAQRMRDTVTAADEEWRKRIEGYESKVALGAPRQYWRERSEYHRKQAKVARHWWNGWLFLILLGSAYVALVLFTPLTSFLLPSVFASALSQGTASLDPSAIFGNLIKHVVIFGTFFGIGLWWLRQKLRELRSHEHLAEDAAERVTMIETFAAMRGAGLSSGDLSLILAALYRPATSGLIPDDTSNPISPLEVLIKTVGNRTPR